MKNQNYLFTSESVSEGHPDKICDQISDCVVDECLKQDQYSRVACEVFTTTGMVLVGGEITTTGYVDVQEIARGIVKKIGYDRAEYGLDYKSMAVISTIHKQSHDISMGVEKGGAGDQGMMFGFACNETPELMPAPIMFAHSLVRESARLRREGEVSWFRPDAKSQVTIEYEGFTPKRIHTVVIAQQHDPNYQQAEIKQTILEKLIRPVLEPTGLFDEKTLIKVNETGKFEIGGPDGDAGLTGRKIIVDTYGGMGRHGGGAFSGKDATKVDRSGAYMARYIAKNIVAAQLCDRVEVQLAYAIGVAEPISIMIDTFGTGRVAESKLKKAVLDIFPLTPTGIIDYLQLRRPIFKSTAAYGHFGRPEFCWEKTDKVQDLATALL
ncbi:MAG TPA: methionine adenosyltransferase [Candidatus Marinimicrobia bacterium]|nr:methionine adenosyltransferase [Candidatus Neomarinimicrobiota bacterium]